MFKKNVVMGLVFGIILLLALTMVRSRNNDPAAQWRECANRAQQNFSTRLTQSELDSICGVAH